MFIHLRMGSQNTEQFFLCQWFTMILCSIVNLSVFNIKIIDLVLPDDSIDSDAEEAYRYLYGLAIEDGIITPNERLMLEFTAENLNLSRAQIDIIEASK